MPWDQADLDQIHEVVRKALKESIAAHPIKCPIPEKAAGEMSHFFGMVEDVGKGDIRQGVENIRGYFKAMDSFLTLRGKMTTWIARSVVGGLLIAIGTLLVLGIKFWRWE